MLHPPTAELGPTGKRTLKGKVICQQVSDLQVGCNRSSPVVQHLERVQLHSSSLVHAKPADTQCGTHANKTWGHAGLGAERDWHFPEPVLSYGVAFSASLGITKALVAPV